MNESSRNPEHRNPGHDQQNPKRQNPRRTVSASQAIWGVLAGLLIAALFSSGSLVDLAERQEFGTTRDVALSAARGFDRFSSFFSLDRPASALSAVFDENETTYDVESLIAIGREQPNVAEPNRAPDNPPDATTPSTEPTIPPSEPTTNTLPPTTTTAEGTTDATAPTSTTQATTTTTIVPPNPTTTTTTTPPAAPDGAPFSANRRQVSQNNPLKLWVGGDSQTLALTRGFGRITSPTLVDYTRDPHISSGLTRPDYLDWPQRLAKLLTENRPEVLVIMFGGNDYQDVYYNGQLLKRPSQAWLDFYRTRVAEAMDLLNQPDVEVIWVGVPIMRDEFFATGMAHLNEIYQSEAASRASIRYFDTWEMFADSNGNYTDRIDGQLVRESDGIHLTTTGGVLAAEEIWATIAPRWGLE